MMVRHYLLEENWEKAWVHYYVTDQKWWIRLVRTESTLHSNDLRPSPNFSPRLQDKIWKWIGDEAIMFHNWIDH